MPPIAPAAAAPPASSGPRAFFPAEPSVPATDPREPCWRSLAAEPFDDGRLASRPARARLGRRSARTAAGTRSRPRRRRSSRSRRARARAARASAPAGSRACTGTWRRFRHGLPSRNRVSHPWYPEPRGIRASRPGAARSRGRRGQPCRAGSDSRSTVSSAASRIAASAATHAHAAMNAAFKRRQLDRADTAAADDRDREHPAGRERRRRQQQVPLQIARAHPCRSRPVRVVRAVAAERVAIDDRHREHDRRGPARHDEQRARHVARAMPARRDRRDADRRPVQQRARRDHATPARRRSQRGRDPDRERRRRVTAREAVAVERRRDELGPHQHEVLEHLGHPDGAEHDDDRDHRQRDAAPQQRLTGQQHERERQRPDADRRQQLARGAPGMRVTRAVR